MRSSREMEEQADFQRLLIERGVRDLHIEKTTDTILNIFMRKGDAALCIQ